MELALNSQDQEDELSCCHHNTHRNIVTNAVGI
jgi:putative iron-regulated protein